MAARDPSILAGTLVMLVLSALLFWIPVIGPLVAGFVGGRKAGSVGAAFVAAILPALVAGGLLYLVVNAFPGVAPWLAALVAGAITIWLLVQAGLVIVGAIAGGASAQRGARVGVPAVR